MFVAEGAQSEDGGPFFLGGPGEVVVAGVAEVRVLVEHCERVGDVCRRTNSVPQLCTDERPQLMARVRRQDLCGDHKIVSAVGRLTWPWQDA